MLKQQAEPVPAVIVSVNTMGMAREFAHLLTWWPKPLSLWHPMYIGFTVCVALCAATVMATSCPLANHTSNPGRLGNIQFWSSPNPEDALPRSQ